VGPCYVDFWRPILYWPLLVPKAELRHCGIDRFAAARAPRPGVTCWAHGAPEAEAAAYGLAGVVVCEVGSDDPAKATIR
jgi:hypothetical protein